jgi:hypothetical protein
VNNYRKGKVSLKKYDYHSIFTSTFIHEKKKTFLRLALWIVLCIHLFFIVILERVCGLKIIVLKYSYISTTLKLELTKKKCFQCF